MNFYEFLHFIHETSLLHFQRDASVLEKIFNSSISKPDCASPLSNSTLSRIGFIQTVLQAIVLHNKLYGDDISFLSAVDKCMRENIRPATQRLCAGPFRDVIHTDVSLSQIASNLLLK